jgi:hypothetical protein
MCLGYSFWKFAGFLIDLVIEAYYLHYCRRVPDAWLTHGGAKPPVFVGPLNLRLKAKAYPLRHL